MINPRALQALTPPSPRSQSMNLLDPRSSNPAPTEPDRRQHPRYTVQVPIEIRQEDSDLPMRLEFLPPNLLLDVAHNPAGAWTLRAAIASLPTHAARGFTLESPRTLIFSCLRDKDLTEISRILFPLFDSSGPSNLTRS